MAAINVSLTTLEKRLITLENTASGTREAYNNLLKDFADEVEERAKKNPPEAGALRNRLENFSLKIEAAKRRSIGHPQGPQDKQKNPIAPGQFQQEVNNALKKLLNASNTSTSEYTTPTYTDIFTTSFNVTRIKNQVCQRNKEREL